MVAKITSLPHTGFKKSLKAVIILSLSPSVGVSGSPISFLIYPYYYLDSGVEFTVQLWWVPWFIAVLMLSIKDWVYWLIIFKA